MYRFFLAVVYIFVLTIVSDARATDSGEFFRCTARQTKRWKNDKVQTLNVARDIRAATKAAAESEARAIWTKMTDALSSVTVSPISCVPIADTPNTSPWQCTVTAKVNGQDKTWQYTVNKELQKYRSDAERYASRQFVRDFDGSNGAVDRASITTFCDDNRVANQPTGKATPPALPSGSWTCNIAMQWQAIDFTGKLARGWYGGRAENVSGNSEAHALGLAYAASQNKWRVMDGAGMRSVNWSGNVGRCWIDRKPDRPIGWPNKYAW